MITTVTRSVQISCAHRLYNNNLTEEKNFKVYGQCTATHGHNYRVEVTWRGPLDSNGMVINLQRVKDVLHQKVITVLDHQCLDELEFFQTHPSTTENLCVFIHKQLTGLDYNQAVLHSIRIHETDSNIFELICK